jgi:hypothetical protein
MAELSWICARNPEIAIEDFGNRSLVFHPEELRLTELNATSREIMARLDGTTPLRQIALALARDFDYPVETVSRDLCETVTQMVTLDLVNCRGSE